MIFEKSIILFSFKATFIGFRFFGPIFDYEQYRATITPFLWNLQFKRQKKQFGAN